MKHDLRAYFPTPATPEVALDELRWLLLPALIDLLTDHQAVTVTLTLRPQGHEVQAHAVSEPLPPLN